MKTLLRAKTLEVPVLIRVSEADDLMRMMMMTMVIKKRRS